MDYQSHGQTDRFHIRGRKLSVDLRYSRWRGLVDEQGLSGEAQGAYLAYLKVEKLDDFARSEDGFKLQEKFWVSVQSML